MYSEVAEFSVTYLQILDEKGHVDHSLEPHLESADLIEMYGLMVRARLFDAKCLKLQRQGRMGTFAPVTGQEAAQVGSVFALGEQDWFVPSFREVAGALTRGAALAPLALYVMGFPQGAALPEGSRDLPIAIPVGSQVLHAAGIGMGMKIKKEDSVVMAFCGDGATSQGDFYEALNFAGAFMAPVIFVVQNNQYAISFPRSKQTHAETLAQKGIAAGIHCIQVDGNDVLAMYVAAEQAVERALAGEGPTVIEAVTYRMMMHTTADDPTRYRSDEEVNSWKKKDPITRFRKYLEKKKLWNATKEKKLVAEVTAEIEKAITEAEAQHPHIDDMFRFVYSEMPSHLQEQLTVAQKYSSIGLSKDDSTSSTFSQHKVVHKTKRGKGNTLKKKSGKKKVSKRKVTKRKKGKVVKKKKSKVKRQTRAPASKRRKAAVGKKKKVSKKRTVKRKVVKKNKTKRKTSKKKSRGRR